jgi:iron complex outermembrane recepter protein
MRHFLLTTTALVIAGTSFPAFAQSAADETSGSEIIVTARQRDEKLIDVPVPVTVATRAQLERDQVKTVTDLQRITPALEVSQTSGGESNGGARLRGLGTGVFNPSVSPSVAFVVDQVSQGNLAFPQIFDMAQVEVLRGPQGTLFGQGASAGVINVTSVAPSTKGFGISGGIDYADKGTVGSEVGELTARAAVNIPAGEKAAFRIATQYKAEKGLQRNTFLKLDNKIDDFAVRVSALLMPSETFTVNLKAEYNKVTSNGWNFFAVASTPTNAGSLASYLDTAGCNVGVISARAEFYCEDTQARFVNTVGGISAVIGWEISDALKLTSVSSYRQANRKTFTVNFSRRLGVAARSENAQNDSEQISQELRLGYKNDKLDLVVGGMYSKFDYEATPINGALGFFNNNPGLGLRTGFGVCNNAGGFCVPNPAYGFTYEKTTNNIFALFTDATFSLTDQLDLFGGLRYSTYKNTTGIGRNSYVANVIPANALAGSTGPDQRISESNLSGRIGLSYKPSENSTIYASASRGYKPGAIVPPTATNTTPAGTNVTFLKPELATAFELGAKFALGRLQLSGNIFYSKVENFQAQDQVFFGVALISRAFNVSEVISKGFEIGLFGKVSKNLSLNAGYQFNDIRFPAGYVDNNGIANLGGTQFLNAPKHKFTFSGEFTAPISGNTEFFLNSNIVYKSDVLLASYGTPEYRYPAHATINGGIGIRNAEGKWKASIFARNLTAQREPTAYLQGDSGGTPDGSLRAWPVAGLTARVVGLSVDFNF